MRVQPAQPSVAAQQRINLGDAAILLVDVGLGLEILSHIFQGFGARTLHRCETVAAAREVVATRPLDLIVTDALLDDEDGATFVSWLRRRPETTINRFAPVIVLSAHTPSNRVAMSRDCGANFFVAKPLSPRVLLDRLIWVAREKRRFLHNDTYSGQAVSGKGPALWRARAPRASSVEPGG